MMNRLRGTAKLLSIRTFTHRFLDVQSTSFDWIHSGNGHSSCSNCACLRRRLTGQPSLNIVAEPWFQLFRVEICHLKVDSVFVNWCFFWLQTTDSTHPSELSKQLSEFWFMHWRTSLSTLSHLATGWASAQVEAASQVSMHFVKNCLKVQEMLDQKVATDPLLCSTNVRARTANELLRAFAHVQQFGHLLWLPIYCHHGTADKLANIKVCLSPISRVPHVWKHLPLWSIQQNLGKKTWL